MFKSEIDNLQGKTRKRAVRQHSAAAEAKQAGP
jgi:hypothetical protein